MSKVNPIESAKAILGEHMLNYCIITVDPRFKNVLHVRFDNQYAAIGMMERAIDILRENVVDDGWEIVWDTNDEDTEDN
tara:strand:+ start:415 stop:651 length:237 start_codon:yes stop_codon:yes gene_type:complete